MGDPSDTELAAIHTLGDAACFLGLAGTEDLLTPRGSFLSQLGAARSTPVALLATFSQDEFNIMVAVDASGAVTSHRNPTIAEVGMGRMIGRICRRRVQHCGNCCRCPKD